MNRILVANSIESGYFASRLIEHLFDGEISVGGLSVIRETFGDGESYYRLGINDRQDLMGADVIYIASTHTDADFLELVRIGSALAGYGTRRRIFVIPFFGYSTMERAVKPGEVVTAKTNARILSAIPNTVMGNTFLMLDLHAAGIVHYFEGDCLRYELYADKILQQALVDRLNLKTDRLVFASADMGRPLWVQSFANQFGTPVAYISKTRNFEETKVDQVIGSVVDMDVFIYDDMVRSAGSLIKAAEAYLEQGARRVYAVVSHLALNDPSIVRKLIDSPILNIVATNSHPMSQLPEVQDSDRFVIVDASEVFAETIRELLEGSKE